MPGTIRDSRGSDLLTLKLHRDEPIIRNAKTD